jgi:AcrR family transcriptional regulator
MIGTFDRRFRKTEDTITQAMIRLLNDKRVQEITLNELIEEADINKSTFYLHYQNLDDLVGALENNGLTLIRSFFEAYSSFEKSFAKELVDFVYENRLLFNALNHAYSYRLREKLLDFLMGYFARLKGSKPKKTLDDEGLALTSLVGALLSIFSSWLDQFCRYAKEKVIGGVDGLLNDPNYSDLIKR